MKKLDYLFQAFSAGLHKKRVWVLSAFSITQEGADAWKKSPYPYRLVRTPSGIFFVNPDGSDNLIKIDDADPSTPLFSFKDTIVVPANYIANVTQDTKTIIGNLFFNLCAIVPAFGKKIPFVTGNDFLEKLESTIAGLLEDTPPADVERKDNVIYVDEYLRFCASFSYLTEFTQLCTWGVTEKAIIAPTGIKEFKKALIEKYKDSLDDPATIARIDAELVKFDSEFLKGDPSENFLTTNKSRKVVRKKLFLMYGGETGLGAKRGTTLIQNSLSEGWELDKFPEMNNALRAGSYDRGAETMLGGEAVKWLLRASSNIRIMPGDCGTKLGLGVHVADNNIHKLINKRIITSTGTKLITSKEEAGAYMGTKLMVRSPMYCILDKTDYCEYCVGTNLAKNKDGASMAITAEGSVMMAIFMSAMHGKELALAKMNIKNAIT